MAYNILIAIEGTMIQQFRELTDSAIKRSFGAGSIIVYQGEVPRSAYVIMSGIVRVFSISSQGEEHIVTMHIKGEFIPSPWIFGKATGSLFFYEALTPTEVALVPKDDLIAYTLSTPERTQALLDYFTTNYAASLVRINALEQSKAREKIVHTFYFLCQRYGRKSSTNPNKIGIDLLITHQLLANLVGLTRETTAVEVSKLKKQKIITYTNQLYTVYLDRLLTLIGEESFRDISISG